MAKVNGVEINLKPSKAMIKEAERFLEWRRQGFKGGTQTAYRRARQIINNTELDPGVVIAMRAWKARHLVDRKAEGFNPGQAGYPSKGRVAAAAWGLPGGDKWVDQKGQQVENARALNNKVDRKALVMEENKSLEKSLKFEESQPGKIDLEAATITGVSLISTPEAKGHGVKVDALSIKSFFQAVEGKKIKAYYTHNDNEALDTIGLWENFEVVEEEEYTKLLGDFTALEAWKENNQEEFAALFELAEKAPESFGVSAEFTGKSVFYKDGEEIEFTGEEEAEELYIRASEVSAFSIVASPAANPNGLFAAKEENTEIKAALQKQAEEILQFAEQQKSDQAQLKTLEKYSVELMEENENLKSQVAELSKEAEAWQIKFAKLADLGSDPVAAAPTEEPKSLAEQIATASSWSEKQKLFKNNLHELTKNWRQLTK